jgi:putative ribosome biogenesis GTPase RsgA
MGKSTLINALIPDAGRATAKISSTLDSGRHTTTHTQLYHLDKNTHIIDSPGIQDSFITWIKIHILLILPEFRSLVYTILVIQIWHGAS